MLKGIISGQRIDAILLKPEQVSGWILEICYKIIICGTVKKNTLPRLYNEARHVL
jgi:hypothetical protein